MNGHPHTPTPSRRARRLLATAAVATLLAAALLAFRAPESPRPPPAPPVPERAAAVDEGTLADTPADADLATLIAVGHRQLVRNSLSRPPRGNAIETFLAAFSREPLHPEVQAGLRATLARLGEQVARYIADGDDGEARRLHGLARDFATRAGLTTEPAWRGFKQQVRDALQAALAAAAAASDAGRGEALSALARALDPDHPDLQPWLDRVAILPAPGDALPGAPVPLVFVAPGGDGRLALAAMAREVSRGEYAEFARATGRAPARCQGDFSLLRFFERRRWDAPGFAQDDTHPAVCVSWEDAEAFARWLATRSGQPLRLPTAADWRRYGGAAPRVADCDAAGRDCDGTRPADRLAADRLGMRGLHGNVAEWLADCAGDCSARRIAGASWRDAADAPEAADLREASADRGYDDIGFRLVLDLPAASTPSDSGGSATR